METKEITRDGNFSSSEIWKLMTNARTGKDFGAPALTYIEEKRMELRLGRSLNSENNAKPTAWGKFVEKRVFDILGTEYMLKSKDRLAHRDIAHWTGAPDCITESGDKVVDIKCPYTLKGFCQLVDSFYSVASFKKEHPDYYWQLVSNAILTGIKTCEIIVYCPYQKELEDIREMANNYDGDQNKIAFLNWATNAELPYLIEGGFYKNINKFSFEAPAEDKELLTERVLSAIELLK